MKGQDERGGGSRGGPRGELGRGSARRGGPRGGGEGSGSGVTFFFICARLQGQPPSESELRMPILPTSRKNKTTIVTPAHTRPAVPCPAPFAPPTHSPAPSAPPAHTRPAVPCPAPSAPPTHSPAPSAPPTHTRPAVPCHAPSAPPTIYKRKKVLAITVLSCFSDTQLHPGYAKI